MKIATNLTRMFHIDKPLILAPMARTSGGELAAAVAVEGGLGLIGAAGQTSEWMKEQWQISQNYFDKIEVKEKERKRNIGIGLVSFLLEDDENNELLETAVSFSPAAIWLSFGIKKSQIDFIKSKSVKVIAQVQTISETKEMIENGVDVIVIQSCDAGGHGKQYLSTSLFSSIPEITDWQQQSNNTHVPIVAAGGIADERGVAAALTLGASGVVIGTRFVSSLEANISQQRKENILNANEGDQNTIPTHLFDSLFGKFAPPSRRWPPGYLGRCIVNQTVKDFYLAPFLSTKELSNDDAEIVMQAEKDGNLDRTVTWAGASVGLVHSIDSARDIVRNIFDKLITILRSPSSFSIVDDNDRS